jgi:hypothetical protein
MPIILVILTVRDVLIVFCSVLKKKKSDIEAAARKLQQVHERFESQRRSLIENESNMVRSLGLLCFSKVDLVYKT